jgi:predicted nucleic acid-binding protein
MIVVDTNIIIYLYLSSERSDQTQRLLRKDPHWVAPLLWRSEFRNVLAQYLRKGFLDLQAALQIMDGALALMRGREYEVVSSAVLSLASESHCSAYDCEFVALAQDLGVELVTVDRGVLAQFADVAVSLETYLARSSQ